MADWPPSLKPIGKYIVRAREVQASQPLVAYYCSHYALKRAIELRDTSDQNALRLVTGLLEKCEAEKAALGSDDGSHRAIVEGFALSVFDRADAEDREGRANKETAQTFYAAVCFFEVCRVFGPLPSNVEQRLRYAKWKAVDISKALKEGRRPVPGAPGEAEAIEEQRLAAEAEKAAEHAAPSAPPPEATDDLHGRQDFRAPHPQSNEPVPPAPPVREYDSDLREYQPQTVPKERSDGVGPYPSVAPPYPSADISPLPHHAPPSTAANNMSAYPSISSAYPTTDAPYGGSNSAYPTTSGYAAPSVPYTKPYATEDISQREQSKGPVMPPIPSLDIPGMGTNMGDPPPGQPLYPPESKASHWPPPSESSYAPPRSNPYAPPESDRSYPPSQLDAPYAPPRSNPPYAPSRPDHVHEQSRPETSYPPQRSEPPRAPQQQPDHGYPSQYGSFGQRPPPVKPPQQAPAQAAKPAVPPPTTQKPASTHVPSIKEAQEAQRLAKYAASALDFQDMKTAVANLEEALKLLKGA